MWHGAMQSLVGEGRQILKFHSWDAINIHSTSPPTPPIPKLTVQTDTSYRAITTYISSKDFPTSPSADYGPTGAFRPGYHVMLCPDFFDLKQLKDMPKPKAGTKLNAQINQGMVLLHELMHVYSPEIKGKFSPLTMSPRYVKADA